MPKILLVKTSSMGDVIHNLPVVCDLLAHFPESPIDWVVEESFTDIPALHPGVRKILPVAVRRWRKTLFDKSVREEIGGAIHALRAERYDIVLDSQSLVKSAVIARLANGSRAGLDWHSAREPLASLLYDYKVDIAKNLHAVERNRLLAGRVLGYTPEAPVNYGIAAPHRALPWLPEQPYAVFLHATSRDDKLWAEANWLELATYLGKRGIVCVLPWGSAREHERAERLAAATPDSIVAPRMRLTEAATLLARARITVGVDTGLAHLAAALAVPIVALYCSTEPGLTGVYGGERAINLGGIGKAPTVTDVITAAERLGAT